MAAGHIALFVNYPNARQMVLELCRFYAVDGLQFT